MTWTFAARDPPADLERLPAGPATDREDPHIERTHRNPPLEVTGTSRPRPITGRIPGQNRPRCAGDAAHVACPMTGAGFQNALLDMAALAARARAWPCGSPAGRGREGEGCCLGEKLRPVRGQQEAVLDRRVERASVSVEVAGFVAMEPLQRRVV